MVDDDKKKDLDSEYSALSDALDSDDSAPSLEDLLKDHGIDLGSDMDLDAMQDFSLSESASSDESPRQRDKNKPKKMSLDDFMEPESSDSDENLFNDHLFADHFKDNLFDEPVAPSAPPPRRAREPEPSFEPLEPMEPEYHAETEDTDIFEASDFDDVNAGGDVDLGGDALFDYDPQGEATEATFADVGGAEPELGGGGGMGGEMPPPGKAPGAKRIFARLGMMLVLVSVIYGGLRFFLAEKTPQTVAHETEAKTPPSKIAQLTVPEHVATTPAPAAAPTTTTPAITPPAAMPEATTAAAPAATTPEVAAVQPSNLPVPGGVTSGLPETAPITTAAAPTTTAPTAPEAAAAPAAVSAMAAPATAAPVAAPMQSLSVAVPMSTISPAGTQETLAPPAAAPSQLTMGTGDVHNKLDNLELALKSIDQRLSQVGSGGIGDDKIQRLERLVNDASAPEMQDVLKQAVKKMKELDGKLDRISELQHQVRMLDTDVKMLKEDVMTQTNMVGEQQRLYNDNVQISQMQEPGPVKMMVQAAIPGRAWLRSERGELLTVIPGDEVPGYGRVVSIDAASGTVVTSSRAVFREQ
ncbi:MAG: hypothetical protein ACHQAX_08325 [Gammaproteobacteria bacterium]